MWVLPGYIGAFQATGIRVPSKFPSYEEESCRHS